MAILSSEDENRTKVATDLPRKKVVRNENEMKFGADTIGPFFVDLAGSVNHDAAVWLAKPESWSG